MGATLHDTPDDRGSLVNAMVHQRDRDRERAGFDQLADRLYQFFCVGHVGSSAVRAPPPGWTPEVSSATASAL